MATDWSLKRKIAYPAGLAWILRELYLSEYDITRTNDLYQLECRCNKLSMLEFHLLSLFDLTDCIRQCYKRIYWNTRLSLRLRMHAFFFCKLRVNHIVRVKSRYLIMFQAKIIQTYKLKNKQTFIIIIFFIGSKSQTSKRNKKIGTINYLFTTKILSRHKWNTSVHIML